MILLRGQLHSVHRSISWLISHAGRYDLVEVFHAMLNEVCRCRCRIMDCLTSSWQFHVHGSDPLDHHNWEVSEMWLTQFK